MGWDWDGSPGGRGYRAPYGANNVDFCQFVSSILFTMHPSKSNQIEGVKLKEKIEGVQERGRQTCFRFTTAVFPLR